MSFCAASHTRILISGSAGGLACLSYNFGNTIGNPSGFCSIHKACRLYALLASSESSALARNEVSVLRIVVITFALHPTPL